MRNMFVIGIAVFALFVGDSYTLHAQDSAQIYIDVGKAQVKKSLVALTPLLYVGTQATNKAHIKAGDDLYKVIFNDLDVSGFFTFIKPDAYLEDPSKVGLRPAPGDPKGFNFNNWKTIGTDFLIRSAYQLIGSELSLEAYVYHVPTAKLIMGKTYKGPTSANRRIAHTFANDLVKALTGKNGMFLSKLVASRQESDGKKEIWISDWDGANAKQISFHNSIAISPTWSHKGDKIAYTAFALHKAQKVRNADLFLYEINTGKRYLVSYRKGINSGANFLPGDAFLLLTLSKGGNADIYKMTADGKALTPITHGPNGALNVEPAISPDGKTIAFSSDRLGNPQVFLMNADGSNVRRHTRVGKYNSSPAWSPDGKTLTFATQEGQHFDIFTIGVDGTNLKRLTDSKKPNGKPASNESPSWSPDGRHILFTSNRTGRFQLYVINADGTNERQITNDIYNWDKPEWSPYLD
ncbi:MAG: translocation protein TolB [Bdellovibrionales bacterium]